MSFQNIIDTAPETGEFDVLAYMTDTEPHKFVVPLGAALCQHQQNALERLMVRDWIRLIDISPVPSAGMPMLCRVFIVMPAAVAWYRERAAS